ncbi:MAG: TonB-dependent receptor [Rhizobiales bacterium]|nr:TonB-dependent receptor [Hyphomicrobiales bacterium]
MLVAGRSVLLLAVPPFVLLGGLATSAQAQIALPEVVVSAPSPIQRSTPASGSGADLQGTLPVVTDQFATVTVVPSDDIRRSGASTLGDLLFGKPGIAGSSFAPSASSRPIIRGLDVNRVRIQENGIGANGASDLGEDHFVPVDPNTSDQVEVIRGPATLRFGSQAIGGVVEATNNRIPTMIPSRGISTEFRGGATSVDNGLDGAVLLDAGAGNFAFHADASGRKTQDYRVPYYPYLIAPNPADAPNATQPGAFNGRQPNSAARSDGQAVGGSYIFNEGFLGLAVVQNNALYHIPGIDGENSHTRIDAHQTKVLSKGEWRAPNSFIDAIRFWSGVTDYKHNEIGLADPTNLTSDGIRQTFTNKEQEGRVEAQLAPFNLRFATLTTAIGVQGGYQKLTAPNPDNSGLWDPNFNNRIAGYMFNEFRFSETTKAQLAGRIEQVNLSGISRVFDPALGLVSSMPVSPQYTPKSASVGLIQNLPWDLVGSITAQYVERAPKPAELFSGGVHDSTVTFDKGNANLTIEAAQSIEVGLRRAKGPFRFEATAYYTKFKGFIYRRLTGNTCDGDAAVCGPGAGDLNEALYSQGDATFRGGEFQSQWDLLPLGAGMFGIENQFDVVRATFSDGTNVPRIPPLRIGGGVYWRDANWLVRVKLLHAFAQNNIAPIAETMTAGYDDLRAELSYKWKPANPNASDLSEVSVGVSGSNLLNRDIRNSVSYSKDEVLMPGASVRLFTSVRY